VSLFHVHEIRTSSCERDGRRKWEKKKESKKCADHVREKGETKLVRELVISEYYSSKLVSIFTYQNFLVKVARLLRVIFLVFSSNRPTVILVRLLGML
jgi:hypothetical protein